MSSEIKDRLEYLRGELRAEQISWGELHELQELAEHIPAGDVELLEAAGVPEFEETKTWNVAWQVVDLIQAETREEALQDLRDRLLAAGFELVQGDAFESEDLD